MKLFEMFSGIGGFSLAFKNVFPESEIIGCSEIDKYASAIYKYNFPNIKNYGDITTIRAEEIPDFDIATFGFPCQDLSIAGKRKGFEGQRSSLFYQAMRIINERRPAYFVFENVKGLFSSHKGKDFEAVLQTISGCGYDGQWECYNSKQVIPQNRERIFFTGFLRGKRQPEIFFEGERNKICNEFGKVKKTIDENSLPIMRNSNSSRVGSFINELNQIGVIGKGISQGERIYSTNGISHSLHCKGDTRTGLYKVNNNIRRLTPIECERLQTFPDNFSKYGIFENEVKEISDSQRYKCLGNAITVKIAEIVFQKIKNVL